MSAPGDFRADTSQAHHQHGLAVQVGELGCRTVPRPVSLLLLLEKVVEVTTQEQHHRQHVLRHARAHGALQIGQERTTLAQQRLLHAAVDAGGFPLDPLQMFRLGEEFGRAHPDGSVGGGEVARRGRGHLQELRTRGGPLKLRQQLVQLLVVSDEDDARWPPARPLAHRLRRHAQPERLDETRGGLAGVAAGIAARRAGGLAGRLGGAHAGGEREQRAEEECGGQRTGRHRPGADARA